jgi:hypothetical protein
MNGIATTRKTRDFVAKGRIVMMVRMAGLGIALVAAAAASPVPGAKTVEPGATAAVRVALERLPRYGVFDFLAFRLDRGAVTLEGYAYGPWLKSDAADTLKGLPGVAEVADTVEILPASQSDDRIRWITFFNIYTDTALERYAPWGATGARFDAFQYGGAPGMQPLGYPIHIIVRGGRTTLVGAVDNAADKQIAGIRAREVPGVFAVENQLTTAR